MLSPIELIHAQGHTVYFGRDLKPSLVAHLRALAKRLGVVWFMDAAGYA